MEITVVINKCSDCDYFEYFGKNLSFVSAPIPLCYYPNDERKESDRILQDNLQIPERCPLKHGAKY